MSLKLCLLVLFPLTLLAQKQTMIHPHLTLCGKTGEYNPTKQGFILSFTREEIDVCDLKLVSVDSGSVISSFRVSITGKNIKYKEYDFQGDSIPQKYKPEIFREGSKTYVEFIKLKNASGAIRSLPPLLIEVH